MKQLEPDMPFSVNLVYSIPAQVALGARRYALYKPWMDRLIDYAIDNNEYWTEVICESPREATKMYGALYQYARKANRDNYQLVIRGPKGNRFVVYIRAIRIDYLERATSNELPANPRLIEKPYGEYLPRHHPRTSRIADHVFDDGVQPDRTDDLNILGQPGSPGTLDDRSE